MSKLSFRARALDASKPMPVFRADEIPDLPDFAAINRAVPQMPTGMEKEEECEHHLQRAISAQQAYGHTGELVIPTPEVYAAPEPYYNDLYPANYKLPRQLIHVQPFAIEHDIPDYDMDSEDEAWLIQQKKVMDMTHLKFEEIMDRLEKSSGQHVVTLKEAKILLKEDDDLIIAVYDYWLNKRLKTQHPLLCQVKTERRDGTTNNNPYVAFRRRTEKMQTRKNRKNDEASYEKMLKLRRDLSRAVNLLELVKHREKTKHDHLKLTIDIYDKRYHIGDYSGQILTEVSALRHIKPTSTYLSIVNNNIQVLKQPADKNRSKGDDNASAPKRRREYKRRHRQEPSALSRCEISEQNDFMYSSDEEPTVTSQPASDQEEEDPDGAYAFKRKKGCAYNAPLTEQLGNWPWAAPEDGGLGDRRYRFCLTSVSHPRQRPLGFARRRVGRGGRIVFDRAWSALDEYLPQEVSSSVQNGCSSELLTEISNEWVHFHSKTPPPDYSSDCPNEVEEKVVLDEEGNLVPVVPITSLSEYIDESELLSTIKPFSELDLESFQSHQEELFEMQRKQLERLKESEAISGLSSAKGASSSISRNDPCNSPEHSSTCVTCVPLTSSAASPGSSLPSSSSTSWTRTSTSTSVPQPSTLDSQTAQFAVTAVLSASEVTGILNSFTLKEPYPPPALPLSEARRPAQTPGTSSNGPLDKESAYRRKSDHSPSPSDAHSEATPEPLSLPSTSVSVCKIKCQNGSQSSVASEPLLPPTDVT